MKHEIYPFNIEIKTWGQNPMNPFHMELFINNEYIDTETFTTRPIKDNEEPYIRALTNLLKRNNIK